MSSGFKVSTTVFGQVIPPWLAMEPWQSLSRTSTTISHSSFTTTSRRCWKETTTSRLCCRRFLGRIQMPFPMALRLGLLHRCVGMGRTDAPVTLAPPVNTSTLSLIRVSVCLCVCVLVCVCVVCVCVHACVCIHVCACVHACTYT